MHNEIKTIDTKDYGSVTLHLEQCSIRLAIYISCDTFSGGLCLESDASTIEWFENADAESVSLAIQDINESEGKQ